MSTKTTLWEALIDSGLARDEQDARAQLEDMGEDPDDLVEDWVKGDGGWDL